MMLLKDNPEMLRYAKQVNTARIISYSKSSMWTQFTRRFALTAERNAKCLFNLKVTSLFTAKNVGHTKNPAKHVKIRR